MKVIEPSATILNKFDGVEVLKYIEALGRTCYKSEDKITDESYKQFISNVMKRNHGSVLEQFDITMRWICDRGVSHELVRHRLCSFLQESTRYCNYSKGKFGKEITFIKPCVYEEGTPLYQLWYNACKDAEKAYLEILNFGGTPEQARDILPISTKTEIVVKANLREWRHIFSLRCDFAAHPQMREIASKSLIEAHEALPIVFDDLYFKYIAES